MMKDSPNGSDNFTPRQVSVLIEEFQGQFRVFGEGQDILKKEVSGIGETLGRTLERITKIELRMDSMETRTDKRFDSVENRIGQILADTTEIKELVANHENRLTNLEASKI